MEQQMLRTVLALKRAQLLGFISQSAYYAISEMVMLILTEEKKPCE